VGSWSPNEGADIFATTSGIGTTTAKDWLPSGTGIPQGGKGAHFDIYASCGGPGTYAALVTIFYTSPSAPRLLSSNSLRKNLEIEVSFSLEGYCFWCVRSFEALFGGLNSCLPTPQSVWEYGSDCRRSD
jgi:hypothetical protein